MGVKPIAAGPARAKRGQIAALLVSPKDFADTVAMQLLILLAGCLGLLVYGAFLTKKDAIIGVALFVSLVMAAICGWIAFAVHMGRAFGGEDASGWLTIFTGGSAAILAIYFTVVALRGRVSAFACAIAWLLNAGLVVGSVVIVRHLMTKL